MTNSPHESKLLKVLMLSLILVAWGCQNADYRAPEGPPVKLSLAVSPATYSGLIAIADDKGYFKDEGLDLSMELYPSGLEALDAVRRGEAQAATVADIAFSDKAPEEPSIRVLASIGTTVGSRVVARKDRNIQSPSDLKGKKVGFSAGTVSDYFLYAFLMSENIPPSDITAVDIPPARQVEALVNGELDAVSAFETFAFEAEKRLGENAVSWDSQHNLAYHWLIATKESVLRSPEPLKRLFRGLVRAEDFVQTHEEETRTILVRKWKLDPVFVLESWHRTRLNVSLGQSVVTSLENYTRWRMGKQGKREDPTDVLEYLDTAILDEVAPKAVSIFR